MVKALFDTNIIIDYLNGVGQTKLELALYSDKAISVITWMEIQVGTTPDDQQVVDQFLRAFTVVPIDGHMALKAVVLRKATKIKLPDAIIWATAQVQERLLITRNVKDFSPSAPDVRVPYVL
ncbi:MAG: type II toxin-antitoxin system VapC family toxin [Rhodoferax sp.]|nr:type II toxin-antitoxin system VapC family toxin [Rhodoferax sp.]MDD4943182.1 type II toxin-antitoxin system VapC family toxin [Rhodoferax sp.]MDD5479941.1 type II toxin-antitoxin system VapC family toxin [Rhodoferax sp.]